MVLNHWGTLEYWRTRDKLRQAVRLLRIKEDVCGLVVLYKLTFSSPTDYNNLWWFFGWVNHLYYLKTVEDTHKLLRFHVSLIQTKSVLKKKKTVNNIFIHFVSFSLEMKKKSCDVFFFLFFLMIVSMWGCEWGWCECSLVCCWGRDFPCREKKEKNSKHRPENSFPPTLFLKPINFVYSDRGPAIVSDEIIKTARWGWTENIKVARSDCK